MLGFSCRSAQYIIRHLRSLAYQQDMKSPIRSPRSSKHFPPTISPMPTPKQSQPRRKRVAIHLPSDMELPMNAKEIKKMKNRVAAARMRQRSQEHIQNLLAQIDHYKRRCEVLEEVIAMCDGCSSLCEVQPIEIDLLPATPIANQEPCASPGSSVVENESILLDEMECAALKDLLHGSVPIVVPRYQ